MAVILLGPRYYLGCSHEVVAPLLIDVNSNDHDDEASLFVNDGISQSYPYVDPVGNKQHRTDEAALGAFLPWMIPESQQIPLSFSLINPLASPNHQRGYGVVIKCCGEATLGVAPPSQFSRKCSSSSSSSSDCLYLSGMMASLRGRTDPAATFDKPGCVCVGGGHGMGLGRQKKRGLEE